MTKDIGPLIIDIAGQTLTKEDETLITHPLVGGIILFARNYADFEQLHTLCDQIRVCAPMKLIMVDQEGGRVQRFVQDFTQLPHMSQFGEIYDYNPAAACYLAKDCGWLMAAEILAAGVDLSLAPVLDLNKGMNAVIGMRAFHSDPNIVVPLAQAFIAGMAEAGMAATGKHFPGHGTVAADSHYDIPVDERSLDDILQSDLLPFTKLMPDRLQAILAAHIIFPKVDNQLVCYSSKWLKDILRDRLHFQGVVFSDDINMEGANISTHYKDRFLAAKTAGCDFILLCNNRLGVLAVIEEVDYTPFSISDMKIQALRGNFSHKKNNLEYRQRWLKTRENLRNQLSIKL